MPVLFFLFVFMFSVPSFADPPTLSQVRKRAIKHAGLDRRDDRWSGRSRWSALLPRVAVRTSWLDDDKTGTKEKSNFFRDDSSTLLHEWTQSETDHDTQARTVWSVQATWDVQKLIFNRDELAADQRAALHRRERLELEEKVARLFTRWSFLKSAVTPAERLECETTAAILDGLTGGWFLNQVAP